MEIFESFGIAQEVSRLWASISKWAVWTENDEGAIGRQFQATNSPPIRTKYNSISILLPSRN